LLLSHSSLSYVIATYLITTEAVGDLFLRTSGGVVINGVDTAKTAAAILISE
jgi:hypothetical protein